MKKLYWAIALLVLASPLGLLAQGTAWGEWSSVEIKSLVGFIPEGMKAVESVWAAPLPDYAVPGQHGILGTALGYVFSGALGTFIILAIFMILGRFVPAEEDAHNDS